MTKTLYAWVVGLCLLLPNLMQAQCDPIPSIVTTTDGLGYIEIDSTDSPIIDLMTNSTASAEYTYALTGDDFNIIRFIDNAQADISDLNAGKYFIWGFSYTGDINLVPGDLVFTGSFSTGCFQISNTAVVIQKLSDGGGGDPCAGVDGGMVALELGGTDTTIVIDGVADPINFTSTFSGGGSIQFTYVVTDINGDVLGIPPGNMVDFDPAGTGTCLVYGLAYTGDLLLMVGDNIDGSPFSTECADLSDNNITVFRLSDGPEAQFFVSSNTQAQVGVYNILSDGSIEMDMFPSLAGDADGIYYNMDDDYLIQLNRTDNVLNAYSDVNANLDAGTDPTVTATSTSDFINGREIAVSGDRIVVAQDANAANGDMNRFYIYEYEMGAFNLVKSYDADINLWGIHVDGSTLYAIVDNSNMLAVYNNFFSQPAGPIAADMMVEIEGMVRTHGLTYDASIDAMILTDVGDAGSDTDGAFTVVKNFMDASIDGMITLDEQVRVEGSMSLLGNPVDIAWDGDNAMIYVAERANGGGRVLGFELPTESGDMAPVYNTMFGGASAIHLPTEQGMLAAVAQVFVSSNTSGQVSVLGILENDVTDIRTFPSMGMDADGIYYDREDDLLYQFNRSDNTVDIYADVALSLDAGVDPLAMTSSTADVVNGREIAVSEDRLVVAQDASMANGDMNAFFVYDLNGSMISLNKTLNADINLWGIHADGERLFAIVDNSNMLAVYDDFFSQPAGDISPSMTIEIENMVRTHGLTYDANIDAMILTDVGEASDDSDGAFIVVPDFATASADGMISADEQLRVEGDMTFLGNPVDVAWDAERARIYIAERANGGGRLLGFNLPEDNGNISPIYNSLVEGTSAVYLNDTDGVMLTNDDDEIFFATPIGNGSKAGAPTVTAYPNPASSFINLTWVQGKVAPNSEATVTIMDNMGRQFYTRSFGVEEGTMVQGMNLNNLGLRPGFYNVLVETPEGLSVQRFYKE